MAGILVADIGATWVRVGMAYYDGGVVVRFFEKFRTPWSSDGLLVATNIINKIKFYCYKFKCSAVSIATFGPIKYPEGTVLNAPNHPAESIPIGPTAREELKDVFVLVSNDAVAGAWGAYNYLVSRGELGEDADLVYLALGTGIGVGVIVEGNLLLGRRGDSHEAGHIVVDYDSMIECGCGGRGHWEAIGSGSALSFGRTNKERLSMVTGAGIASLVACYDPEIVVLDGGLVENRVIDLDSLVNSVRRYAFQGRTPRIVVSPVLGETNLVGAFFLVRRPDVSLWRLNGW